MAKVAILGTGGVGTNLGRAYLRGGAAVKYGSRDPSSAKVAELLSSADQKGATAATFDDAIGWADAVILATPGPHDDDGIKKLAASLAPAIDGKILIDATNPLTAYPGLEVRWGQKLSAGEVLQQALPSAFVYKAFNIIGAEHHDHGDGSLINNEPLTMLFAGAEEKKDDAAKIIAITQFVPIYVGPIRYARNLEAIAELWIHMGVPPVGESRVDVGRFFHFQFINKA